MQAQGFSRRAGTPTLAWLCVFGGSAIPITGNQQPATRNCLLLSPLQQDENAQDSCILVHDGASGVPVSDRQLGTRPVCLAHALAVFPQGDQRVDAAGAAGGQITREECHGQQDQRCSGEADRIGRAGLIAETGRTQQLRPRPRGDPRRPPAWPAPRGICSATSPGAPAASSSGSGRGLMVIVLVVAAVLVAAAPAAVTMQRRRAAARS